MKHRVADELHFVAVFVSVVWAVFLLDFLVPGTLNVFGLAPRSMSGLTGVFTMPFLHGGWGHLIGNTFPLIVLLCLLAGSRANTYLIVPQIILLGGLLLWVFGRANTIHVGASGLVYGLIAFLITAGFREGRVTAIAIAIFVGVTYGVTLFKGVLPISVGKDVSWDGHLLGAVAGVIVARFAIKPEAKQRMDIA